MDSAWFGEVRSALAGETDGVGWVKLCRLLSAPEAEACAEQWLPYVHAEVVRRWPTEVRHATLDWLKRVAASDKPAAWPLIWRVWMRGAGVGRAVVDRFVEQDALKHAAWIDAGVMELSAADVARLMDGLTGARVDVSLTHNKLGEGRAWRWLEHPHFSKIAMLELRDSGLDLEALERLCAVSGTLRGLELGHDKVLAGGPPAARLAPLERLRLDRVGLTMAGLAWALEGQEGLVELHLAGNPLGAPCAHLLAQRPFTRLRTLDLCDVGIGVEGARALAQAPWIARLETFRINDLWGDEALDALFDSPYLEDSQLRWQFDKMAPTDYW